MTRISDSRIPNEDECMMQRASHPALTPAEGGVRAENRSSARAQSRQSKRERKEQWKLQTTIRNERERNKQRADECTKG